MIIICGRRVLEVSDEADLGFDKTWQNDFSRRGKSCVNNSCEYRPFKENGALRRKKKDLDKK